jgi:ribonuclease T2
VTDRVRRLIAGAIAALALLSVAAGLRAQYAYDDDYGTGDARSTQRNIAGEFDYYALVMSWSPTHCASPQGSDDTEQCERRDGKRYAFVLHGLWPQYTKGYPETCRTRRRPFVPRPLIDSMLDIMPSAGLIIHEYRKHGTCSGLEPDAYYQLSRRLYQSIRIPERYTNPFETLYVSPEELKREFVRANPQLNTGMLAVVCQRGGGNKLREIRICMTRDGKPQSCGSNEDPGRLCRASQVSVPPVRSMR